MENMELSECNKRLVKRDEIDCLSRKIISIKKDWVSLILRIKRKIIDVFSFS